MQQINLYVAELRPSKDWFSAKYLASVLAGVVVVLMLMHYLKHYEVAKLETQLEEKQLVLRALEIELDKSKNAQRPSSRQDIESNIGKLQKKIASRERLANLIKGQTLDENFSFQSAMTSMAKHASTRVSLTQFTFSRGGKLIEMSGEAIRSYDVPEYLSALRADDAFSQSQFGLITIGNVKRSGNVQFSMGYNGTPSFSLTVAKEDK
ncbi:MAG TPA: hypothetical protein VIC26_12910 [Marinagarivorans sp.]